MSGIAATHETIGSERLLRLNGRDIALWSIAFVVVVVVQTAAVYALTRIDDVAEAPGAPPPAIMIELSEVAVAPQVEDIAAEDGELALQREAAQPVEASPAEPVTETETDPTETAEPTTEPVVEEVAEAILPEPVVEPPTQTVEPVVEEAPVDSVQPIDPTENFEPEVLEEPVQAEMTEEVIPDLVESETAEVSVPMPRPAPAQLEERRREYAEVAREAQQKREAERKKQREEAAKQQQQQAASQQTAPRSIEAQQSERVAASQQSSTTRRTPSVSPQRWQSQVIAHINRNKRYPSSAQKRREEGVVQLQFVIDTAGNVQSSRIVRSSGFAELDQATLEMIRRASPVPAPPADIGQSRITLTVPINFNLR